MFKKAILGLVVAVAALVSVQDSQAQQYVRGHYRSTGTNVAPYFRSNPDGNFYNNYSTFPNINPYTGHIGTHRFPSYSPYRYSTPHNSARPYGF